MESIFENHWLREKGLIGILTSGNGGSGMVRKKHASKGVEKREYRVWEEGKMYVSRLGGPCRV